MSDQEKSAIPCPFTYANGRCCSGVITRAKGYGPKRGGHFPAREDVRKYRLWCSEKDDHAGTVSSFEAKQRMEFYPDQLAPDVVDRLWTDGLICP